MADWASKDVRRVGAVPGSTGVPGCRSLVHARVLENCNAGNLGVLRKTPSAFRSTSGSRKALETAHRSGEPLHDHEGQLVFLMQVRARAVSLRSDYPHVSVLRNPVQFSGQEIASFAKLYQMNARPVQPPERLSSRSKSLAPRQPITYTMLMLSIDP